MKTYGQFFEDLLNSQLKIELQTEQVPTMQSTPYNVMIARQQASRKRARETHAQQEIGAEARAQEKAKQNRLKAIMSRE